MGTGAVAGLDRRSEAPDREAGGADLEPRTPAERLAGHLPFAAAVVLLSAATWLYWGYRYGVWPQPGFLDYVFRYDGQYTNDFHTSLPPVHWFFSNALGLLPAGAIVAALVVLWIAGVAGLWTAFGLICRALGMRHGLILAAGLLTIPTALSGFGASATIFGYVYPTATSFVLALGGLAALLHRRWALAGALLGLAVLVHPNLGVLYGVTLALGAWAVLRPSLRDVVRFAVPAIVLGLPSVLQALLNQASGSDLPADELYDLFTIVSAPHHVLYSAFTPAEYAQTAVWAIALVAGLAALRASAEVRVLGAVAVVAALACAAGALASELERPVLLVLVQTSRLSPLFVLLGIVLAALWLGRLLPIYATPALLAVFLLAPELNNALYLRSTWYAERSSVSAAEGLAVLGLLAFALVRGRVRPEVVAAPRPRFELGGAVVTVVLVLVAAGSLAENHDERNPPPSVADAAFEDIGERARQVSAPADVFLTSPELGGFRTFARRATVVEFGTFRYGEGAREWRRRMIDVTGDPRTVSIAVGPRPAERNQLIADAYDRAVRASRAPLCRYRVRYVVARNAVVPPRWLQREHYNAAYSLYRVRPGTCP